MTPEEQARKIVSDWMYSGRSGSGRGNELLITAIAEAITVATAFEKHQAKQTAITPDHLDRLGRLADTADNLAGASKLPLRAEMHVEQLRNGLERLSKELKQLYVAMSGEDPWEE